MVRIPPSFVLIFVHANWIHQPHSLLISEDRKISYNNSAWRGKAEFLTPDMVSDHYGWYLHFHSTQRYGPCIDRFFFRPIEGTDSWVCAEQYPSEFDCILIPRIGGASCRH